LLAVGMVLGVILATIFAARKQGPATSRAQANVAGLSIQVDALQAKIKNLEERLAKVETEKTILSLAPLSGGSAITVPQSVQNRSPLEEKFADPNRPPKIWGEGECNGWKYYMIPLSSSGRETAMTIPLAEGSFPAR
jgi:hypothetical protein